MLEPIVNKLKGVSVNFHNVHKFIKPNHLEILNKHKENTEQSFKTIFE